jgi:hypothetical protein
VSTSANDSGSGQAVKWLSLAGVAFVVLVVASILLTGSTPDENAPAREIATYYDDDEVRQGISAFMLAAGGAMAALFAVRLALAFWPADGRRPVWQIFQIAGGTAAGLGFALAGMIHFALAGAGDTEGAAQALNQLDNASWLAFNSGMGLLMLGAAATWLSQSARPRWLGWIALVLGIALFLPFADFIALLVSGAWIIAVSIILVRSAEANSAAPISSGVAVAS